MVRFLAPSTWRARASDGVAVAERSSFDSEDGEELDDVDESIARGALSQQSGDHIDSTRRLSRELVLMAAPLPPKYSHTNERTALRKGSWMIVMTKLKEVEADERLPTWHLVLAPFPGEGRFLFWTAGSIPPRNDLKFSHTLLFSHCPHSV